MVNNTYEYFCYCCGKLYRETASSTPTQCQCCSSTDIQTQYHKCNFIATADPGADNDDTEGYCVGSKWINVSTGMIFQCVDATTDAAVWKCVTIEHDWIEEFNLTPDYLPKDSPGSSLVYNSKFVLIDGNGTPSKVDSTKLRLTSGAIANDAIEFATLHAINPADHTYLEIRWKYKQSSTDFSPQIYIFESDQASVKYFVLTKVNATTINVYTTGDGEVTSEDYDVAHVLTSEVEFCLKIKNGEMKFYIDDVLKATFTVANAIWYDVTKGCILYMYGETDLAGAKNIDLDYIKFLTGRPF